MEEIERKKTDWFFCDGCGSDYLMPDGESAAFLCIDCGVKTGVLEIAHAAFEAQKILISEAIERMELEKEKIRIEATAHAYGDRVSKLYPPSYDLAKENPFIAALKRKFAKTSETNSGSGFRYGPNGEYVEPGED